MNYNGWYAIKQNKTKQNLTAFDVEALAMEI